MYTNQEPMPVSLVVDAAPETVSNADLMVVLEQIRDASAAVPVTDNGGSLTVDGILRIPTVSFTRPADTAVYADGDLVANSTTAGSVTPLEWVVAGSNNGSGMVRKARMKKSSVGITNTTFRLHLFTVVPTIATTGDNGVFATVVSGVASYVGAFDITLDRAFADGASGAGAPHTGSEANFVCASNNTKLYGLLEAKAAYTPVSGETITVELEVVANT